MIALLDVDQVCYSVGFTLQNEENVSIVKIRTDEYINNRLNYLGTRDCELYLTDSGNNFRKTIYPEYKANRDHLQKPRWFKQIREHLQDGWGAEVIDYLEADDCVSIRQHTLGHNSILVSDDKDLDQVPGYHMKMSSFKEYEITPEQGLRNLYSQLLSGDRIDNIPGIPWIGKTKADKILSQCGFDAEHLYRMCQWKRAEKLQESYLDTKIYLTCLYMLQTDTEYETVHQAMKDKSYMNILEIL